jgi:hypothetical protein
LGSDSSSVAGEAEVGVFGVLEVDHHWADEQPTGQVDVETCSDRGGEFVYGSDAGDSEAGNSEQPTDEGRDVAYASCKLGSSLELVEVCPAPFFVATATVNHTRYSEAFVAKYLDLASGVPALEVGVGEVLIREGTVDTITPVVGVLGFGQGNESCQGGEGEDKLYKLFHSKLLLKLGLNPMNQ